MWEEDAAAVRHSSALLEAIPSRLEAIASRLEAIAIRLEAVASRLEAIAISALLYHELSQHNCYTWSRASEFFVVPLVFALWSLALSRCSRSGAC